MRISLSPSLDRFVADKIRSGAYVDAGEVVRDGLRRWKEQEEEARFEPAWLEEEIQEALDSHDLPQDGFWQELRKELHTKAGPEAGARRR